MLFTKKKIDWAERGRAAGGHIARSSIDLANALGNGQFTDAKLSNDGYESLLFFGAALFALMVDHLAFSGLAEDSRATFMDAAYATTVNNLCELANIPADARKPHRTLFKAYMDDLAPYAGNDLFPPSTQSPAGNLFWEYSKMLNSKLKLDNGLVIAGSMAAPMTGLELAKAIKPIIGS